jgi:hypothetical protein
VQFDLSIFIYFVLSHHWKLIWSSRFPLPVPTNSTINNLKNICIRPDETILNSQYILRNIHNIRLYLICVIIYSLYQQLTLIQDQCSCSMFYFSSSLFLLCWSEVQESPSQANFFVDRTLRFIFCYTCIKSKKWKCKLGKSILLRISAVSFSRITKHLCLIVSLVVTGEWFLMSA